MDSFDGEGDAVRFDGFCMSSYLAFRYVVDATASWAPGVTPGLPEMGQETQIPVGTPEEIHTALGGLVREALGEAPGLGILLSGGIDSAILAAMLPRGTKAYVIRFDAPGAVDESVMAGRYAEAVGLDLRVVSVGWEDYLTHTPKLMAKKRAPLHAVEVGLHMAALRAQDDGVDTLMLGNGADSTFGGMDKLLSRDWGFEEFAERYTFIDPARVLSAPVPVMAEYEKYRTGDGIDFVAFLKHTHGVGIIQAFDNAIGAAGSRSVEPYEQLRMDRPLDLERIRSGEPKYLLQEVFRDLYPDLEPPAKIPFARPMDAWLGSWQGPHRSEFREDIDLSAFSGDQRWLIWCLERFLDQLEEGLQ